MSQATMLAAGMAIGAPGQLYDSGPMDALSGFNEDTTQMPFGYGIRFGTGRDRYVLATGFSTVVPIQGVNLRDMNHARAGSVDSGGAYQGDMGGSGLLQYAGLQVLRKGRVLLPVEAAPSIGDRLWCRGVATGTLTRGSWRGAAPGAAPLSASYHVDCARQGVFITTSSTSVDGTTLVAVAEVDFTSLP
jgi:hypothetical protein